MESLYDLCDMLDEEVRGMVRKGDISPTELDRLYKAVDIIKDIKTIDAMENYDSYDSYMGGSYGSYDDMSGRMAYDGRRGRDADNDGRYSEAMSNRRGYRDRGRGYRSYDGGMSGDENKQQMLQKIEQMKKQIEQMQ